jgi:hypothetical protein
MQDNVQMPIATPFTLRSKDISADGDGSLQAALMLSRLYPLDWSLNGVTGGMYQHTAKSGTMAAGLAAAAPIFGFQWPSSTLLCAVRRLKIGAWSLGVGFSAGLATFDMYVARAFTAQDSGGTTSNLAGNSSKLRTSMATAAASMVHSSTAALAAGTRTLDPAPIESWGVAAPTAANAPFNATPAKLFEKLPGEHPLLLAQNEGFVVEATVPATGTWQFAISVEWDELPIF